MDSTVSEIQTLDEWVGFSTTIQWETTVHVDTTDLWEATTVLADTTSLSSVVTPVPPSVESSGSSTSSSSSPSSQSTPTGDPPRAAQLSTGSIVGIAVGSVAALVLFFTFLFFAFGFRIQRARRRNDNGIIEHKKNQPAAAVTPGSQNGKAELEDAGYPRRLEMLHEEAKPELEGSRIRKTGWRAFSIRSLRRGPGAGVAELDAGFVTRGPHELPT